MLDMVFVVDNAEKWHTENMKRNNSHYSRLMSLAGASNVAYVQKDFGGRIYYNSNVQIREIVNFSCFALIFDFCSFLLFWEEFKVRSHRREGPCTRLGRMGHSPPCRKTSQASQVV